LGLVKLLMLPDGLIPQRFSMNIRREIEIHHRAIHQINVTRALVKTENRVSMLSISVKRSHKRHIEARNHRVVIIVMVRSETFRAVTHSHILTSMTRRNDSRLRDHLVTMGDTQGIVNIVHFSLTFLLLVIVALFVLASLVLFIECLVLIVANARTIPVRAVREKNRCGSDGQSEQEG